MEKIWFRYKYRYFSASTPTASTEVEIKGTKQAVVRDDVQLYTIYRNTEYIMNRGAFLAWPFLGRDS